MKFVANMLFVEFCKTLPGNEKSVTVHVFYIFHKTHPQKLAVFRDQ